MTCYRVRTRSAPLEALGRDTIGGRPHLAPGQAWPHCECGDRMVHFFQVDIPADVAGFGGSHLLVFQCPTHNDACLPPGGEQLGRFWERPSFWRILLNPAGPIVTSREVDPYLAPGLLTVSPFDDAAPDGRGLQLFKIGGTPSWAQDPERYRCACGAPLEYLAQVPESFGFARRAEAPEQPDAFDDDAYCLFLGNEVYLHACMRRCDPRAVWPINQN